MARAVVERLRGRVRALSVRVRRRPYLLTFPAWLLIVLVGAVDATTPGVYTGDSTQLVRGAITADGCLGDGQLSGCGRDPDVVYCVPGGACAEAEGFTHVGPFAVLQYAPAFAMHQWGRAPDEILAGLVGLSGLSVLVLLIGSVWATRRLRGDRAAVLLTLALLASPLLWYSHAAFGEALAAAVITLFVVAVLLRWPPIVAGLLLFLAGLTKETALPYLLFLGVAAHLASPVRPGPTRGVVTAAIVGSAAALAANTAFNLFRFGSPLNLFYMADYTRMPLDLRPEYLLALVVSPNGGIALFAPLAVAVVVGSAVGGVGRSPSRWRDRASFAGAAPVVILLLLLVGLASWFSPFGFVAWGPRLAVPWIPAVVLIAIVAEGGRVSSCLLGSPRRAIATGLATALFAAPQLGALLDSAGQLGRPSSEHPIALTTADPAPGCPDQGVIQVDPSYYYDCLHYNAWERDPVLFDAGKALVTEAPGAMVLLGLATVGLAGYGFAAGGRRP